MHVNTKGEEIIPFVKKNTIYYFTPGTIVNFMNVI
jgi:hypothetical protein